MTQPVIRKGFINAGGGQVHYRSAGSGPPIILLHDSPRSSVLHIPQIAALADQFTAITIDTPGYGLSTPLNLGRPLAIPDFGRALAETIEGLGMTRCPVYGFHTSSKIALSFAAQHPERVAIAMLDGLSLPSGEPNLPFIDAYMKPFVIDDTGGYLATEWTRALDFQRWFPWFDKRKETRQSTPARDLAALHAYSMDFFMAGPHFSDAYRAAMMFQAAPLIPTLKARTAFMCRTTDVLHGFLAAIPRPLPEGATVESLPPEREPWLARLRALFAEYADFKGAAHFTAPDPFQAKGRADRVMCSYIDGPDGQILVRRAGDATAGRPIVFLHDLPGSARADEDLLIALATASGRVVYAIDMPGCNESAAPAAQTGEAVTDALIAAITALGLKDVDLIAEGLSTAFAALVAKRAPQLVHRLLLDAVFIADADHRTEMKVNYAPDLRPQRDGVHLHRAFHMLRDQEVCWPWYEGSPGSIRKVTPRLEPLRQHARLVDTLKQYQHYADAIVAACTVDTAGLLRGIDGPVTVCMVEGDVRYAAAATVDAPQILRPQNVADRAAAFARALI